VPVLELTPSLLQAVSSKDIFAEEPFWYTGHVSCLRISMNQRHIKHQLHMVDGRSTLVSCCPQSALSLYHRVCSHCASVQGNVTLDAVVALLRGFCASHSVMEKRTLHPVKTCHKMTNIPGTSLNVQAMPKVVDVSK